MLNLGPSSASPIFPPPSPPTVIGSDFLDSRSFSENLPKSYIGAPWRVGAPLLQGILDPPLLSDSKQSVCDVTHCV